MGGGYGSECRIRTADGNSGHVGVGDEIDGVFADLFEKLLGLGMWIEVRVQRLQGVRGGVQAVLRRRISAPGRAAVFSGNARRRHCLNHPSPSRRRHVRFVLLLHRTNCCALCLGGQVSGGADGYAGGIRMPNRDVWFSHLRVVRRVWNCVVLQQLTRKLRPRYKFSPQWRAGRELGLLSAPAHNLVRVTRRQ